MSLARGAIVKILFKKREWGSGESEVCLRKRRCQPVEGREVRLWRGFFQRFKPVPVQGAALAVAAD
ncbi:MAG: hypothetical protein KME26_29380 [Oscillatoria princeps RMCB-10]|nr:hypothetical protein [Oscillatoria princeps RMCB-10]